MALKIRNLYPGSWGSNCYLLTVGGNAAVVDPSADAKTILAALKEEGASLRYILLTHGHFDHIVSIDTLRKETGAPVLIHESELDFPSDPHKNAFYDFFFMEQSYGRPEEGFTNGQELLLGEEVIRVIHTPGHTCGSCCFLCNDEFLITGDTLFAGGFGRFDLYSGDGKTLMKSLESLKSLPGHLPIYPGHGGSMILSQALHSIDI
ncbi:MAG: MBL fold metallo-hydrolase [Clostridia bacterium]|nr:MBL fold metallo-hydrolase [Clostridia bacterium]